MNEIVSATTQTLYHAVKLDIKKSERSLVNLDKLVNNTNLETQKLSKEELRDKASGLRKVMQKITPRILRKPKTEKNTVQIQR